MRFIIRILANALAIYLAAFYIPGVIAKGDWKLFFICGIVLSLINIFIKPILKFISLPFIFLTLGLFGFVVNIIVVWLLTKFVPQLIINGLLALFLTSLLVSIINGIVSWLTKKSPKLSE